MVRTFDDGARRRDEEFEQQVRDALRTEAETVEPSAGGLREIQARTAGGAARRARTRWFAGGTAALATAAAVTAIALAGSLDLGLGGPEETGPAAPAGSEQALAIFYLDSTPERRGEPGSVTLADPKLYREVHQVAVSGSRVEAAVRELATSTPEDLDYVNPWAGTTIESVRMEDERVVVEADGVPTRPRFGPGQQLAHTVRAATNRDLPVVVVVDGVETAPVRPETPLEAFAGIWVTTPEHRSTVSSPVTFAGNAATFEGNVAYEITRQSDGKVVADGATITQGGMGVWSEWSVTEELAPGTYVVTAFDEDAALGGRRDVDTKTFTVE